MIEKLPENVRSRQVAKAMFSPSATLLAGAGVSVAILAGAPIVAAAAVGALAWLGRVALAVPRKPREMRVDPNKLRDPWRRSVVDALDAKRSFELACNRTRQGPLKERLVDIGRRIDTAVQEVWRIAQQGEALQSAYFQLEVEHVEEELAGLVDQPSTPTREAAISALKAQLQAGYRIRKVGEDAIDRLKILNARLDEAVARAVELSVGTLHEEDLLGVSNQVDSLVQEMEHVRQALEETQGTRATAAGGAA
jgi:hypothetical protein